MQWTDVQYGDDATPEQMNTVAHGVMAVEEWLNQIVGLPSMTGNQGKILTTDGNNASWGNKLITNSSTIPVLTAYGVYNQSGSIFNIRKFATEEQDESNSYSYFNVTASGDVSTNNLRISGAHIRPNSGSSYADLGFYTDGIIVSRNLADGYPVFTINQINPASTGHIVDFQFASINKVYLDRYGNIYSSGFNLQIETSTPPASSTSDGLKGSIRWDKNYIYVCTDTNTWKRTSLTTW